MKYFFTFLILFSLNINLLIQCSNSTAQNHKVRYKSRSAAKAAHEKSKLKITSPEFEVNHSLMNELKNSKFYARGRTNLGDHDKCTVNSRWGPAKDVSYFLYDLEPYEGTPNDSGRKRRMKRKQKDKTDDDNDDDNEVCDDDDAADDDDDCDDENEYGDDGSNLTFISRNSGEKTKKKSEKHRIRRHLWEDWGPWGPCSATCGKGTRSRWRHCMSNSCPKGEKQAQVKECLVPCKSR